MPGENAKESERSEVPNPGASDEVNITDTMVDAVIAYLEDCDSGGTSMWVEMVFMERVLGDLSPHKGDLEYRLGSSDSPVYRADGLSEARLRAIAVALRRRARRVNGQPPLTPEQEATWRFETPTYPPRRRKSKFGERIREWVVPTPDEERQIAAYLNSNYPEIIKYWIKILQNNSGMTDQEYQKSGVDGWYFYSRLDEAVDQIVEFSHGQTCDVIWSREMAIRIASEFS